MEKSLEIEVRKNLAKARANLMVDTIDNIIADFEAELETMKRYRSRYDQGHINYDQLAETVVSSVDNSGSRLRTLEIQHRSLAVEYAVLNRLQRED